MHDVHSGVALQPAVSKAAAIDRMATEVRIGQGLVVAQDKAEVALDELRLFNEHAVERRGFSVEHEHGAFAPFAQGVRQGATAFVQPGRDFSPLPSGRLRLQQGFAKHARSGAFVGMEAAEVGTVEAQPSGRARSAAQMQDDFHVLTQSVAGEERRSCRSDEHVEASTSTGQIVER